MSPALTPARAVLQLLRDSIPLSKQEYEKTSKETVQMVVWTVTLATGLLSLAALNSRFLAGLSQSALRAEIALLLSTIFFGVLQRVLQHLFDQFFRSHLLGLYTYLVGASVDTATPPAPDLMVDCDKVIAALRDHFQLDYSFLKTYNVPLAGCQEAYKTQYDFWRTSQENATKSTLELVAAYTGQPTSWVERIMANSPTDLEAIRKKTRWLTGLGWSAFAVFVLTALGFLGAMLVLGWGVLQHLVATATST
jgi:hypothetical protein